MEHAYVRTLLARYQQGECTPDEARVVEQWYELLGHEQAPLALTPAEREQLRTSLWQHIETRTRLDAEDLSPPTAAQPWYGRAWRWAAAAAVALAEGTNHHRYVFVTMRTTPNRGGYAFHSAQRVPIDNSKGERFSLTQQWYMAGTQFAGGESATQDPITDPILTVEFGIQCLPSVFGSPGPTLWVGATNNGYDFSRPNGGFQYNTRPGSGFVQTNADWGLGTDLAPFGVLNGPQYYLGMGAYLTGGRWWVYFGGNLAKDAVGYWPASWWTADGAPNGAGMSQRAGRADWGAEISSLALADGTMHYPAMGHGAPALDRWRRAAYIRDMIYYGDDGVTRAVPAATTVANLNDLQPGQSTARHTSNLGLYGAYYGYKKPWGRTLWFGGPGAVLDGKTGVTTIRPNPA